MAGGKSVPVPLYPPEISADGTVDAKSALWRLDFAELEAAFTPQTKLFLLNTPHNPTGSSPFCKAISLILFIFKFDHYRNNYSTTLSPIITNCVPQVEFSVATSCFGSPAYSSATHTSSASATKCTRTSCLLRRGTHVSDRSPACGGELSQFRRPGKRSPRRGGKLGGPLATRRSLSQSSSLTSGCSSQSARQRRKQSPTCLSARGCRIRVSRRTSPTCSTCTRRKWTSSSTPSRRRLSYRFTRR